MSISCPWEVIWNSEKMPPVNMACITDRVISKEYGNFLKKWHKDNPGKNHYDDYFAALFQKSYEVFPQKQREGGDFIQWSIPVTQHSLIMAASGLGDGAYVGFWGMNEQGDAVELIVGKRFYRHTPFPKSLVLEKTAEIYYINNTRRDRNEKST